MPIKMQSLKPGKAQKIIALIENEMTPLIQKI
jgi:hypothetical protein